jgi:formate hydrogenlyase transcriptional activator
VLELPLPELQYSQPSMVLSAPATETVSPEEDERQRVLRVLRETNGVVAGPRGAAQRLGLKRTTLLSRMKKWGISVN